ncbi:MAG: hypothetical protein WB565_18095 [Acidimicrobiales bacterium]
MAERLTQNELKTRELPTLTTEQRVTRLERLVAQSLLHGDRRIILGGIVSDQVADDANSVLAATLQGALNDD